MAFYNLNSTWEYALQQELHERTKHRIYRYRINRNVAAGLIKRWLSTFLIDEKRQWEVRNLVLKENLLMHLEPYRKRPHRARNRKLMRGQVYASQ